MKPMNRIPVATSPRRVAVLFVLVCAALASGCVSQGNRPRLVTQAAPPIPTQGQPVPATNQAVLADGTQLIARSADGQIKIEAGPGTRRVYSWDGFRRGAVLKPRAQPFAGARGKGLYFDGRPQTWAPADGIVRLRAEEGKRDFDNMDDAKIWMQIRRLYYVYNDDGLAVGWQRAGNTLKVEVWQFYIDDKKPTEMVGAKDPSIATGPVRVVAQKPKRVLKFPDGHTEPYTTATAHKLNGTSAPGKSNWFQRNITQPVEDTLGLSDKSNPDKAGSTKK